MAGACVLVAPVSRAVHRVPTALHVERHRLGSEGVIPYRLTRLGMVMAPDPDDPMEAEGVLNPAAGYTSDGRLHLLPRWLPPGMCPASASPRS